MVGEAPVEHHHDASRADVGRSRLDARQRELRVDTDRGRRRCGHLRLDKFRYPRAGLCRVGSLVWPGFRSGRGRSIPQCGESAHEYHEARCCSASKHRARQTSTWCRAQRRSLVEGRRIADGVVVGERIEESGKFVVDGHSSSFRTFFIVSFDPPFGVEARKIALRRWFGGGVWPRHGCLHIIVDTGRSESVLDNYRTPVRFSSMTR